VSATRTLSRRARVAAGFVLWAICVSISIVSACHLGAAERVLFPSPLHITRELFDPVSEKTTVIDEYCQGNRMVSVTATRTAIADYAGGELTEIDFAAGTYSVTKFAEIAGFLENTPSASRPRATTNVAGASGGTENNQWRVEARGGSVIASRPADTTEAERKDGTTRRTIRVSADRQLSLSRGAVEALLGIGYPYPRNDDGDVLLGTLRSRDRKVAANDDRKVAANGLSAVGADAEYHLPLEQVFRFEMGGETVETRNVVTRIGSELPPAEALAIPPGAKLVESKVVAMRRHLEELDRPPSAPSGH
jgi:hypothetical protein